MQPGQGQLSLLAVSNDLDDAQNGATGRYEAHRGIVAAGGDAWRGYAPGTSEDTARAAFWLRFGVEPETVWIGPGGLVLAGPIQSIGAIEAGGDV
jgi:hypothetical protein